MILSYPARFYEDSGYASVEFPDLPGCFTFGDTQEQAVMYAHEAVELYLQDHPHPLPEPSDPSAVLTDDDSSVRLITVDIDTTSAAV